ncbi:MAG: hypothetical protein CMP10_04365 [Zetaproteobacteria bacterium]|nr:hypothetical protein [Pseudobdellovibrionaceae bacterium]|tara:strand:+ start:1140 stop:1826 length:687 start_codon:yes stop_codon:yes gene_type:complete
MKTSTDDTKQAIEAFTKKHNLTRREKDIFSQLVLKNVTAEGIAKSLEISKNTVRIHFQNIFSKIGITSKSELLGTFVDFLIQGEEIIVTSNQNKVLRIMIAEDDTEFKNLMIKAFNKIRNNGIDISDVNDTAKLIAHLEESKSLPDLIVLNNNMPVSDEFSVLKDIKNQKALEHIPVIMFSKSHDQEEIKKAYSLGVNSYLKKPSGFKSLVKVLDIVIDYWEHNSYPV